MKEKELPYPLTSEGMPTSRPAYRIISALFQEPRRIFDIKELTEISYAEKEAVELICLQLAGGGIITETKDCIERYQYDLKSSNTDFQARVEKNLLDFPGYAARLDLY